MANWNQYDAPNTGLLFYKHLYKQSPVLTKNGNSRLKIKTETKGAETWEELIIEVEPKETSPFDQFYKDLYEKKPDKPNQIQNPAATEKFSLVTTYPGLLIGSGYNHNTKARGDAAIGFFFDHTTGQPVIPGSSVKGVCRSVFELDINDRGRNVTGKTSLDFFKHMLEDVAVNNPALDGKINGLKTYIDDEKKLKQLKENIFGDQKKAGKDIFFDAVLNIEASGNNTIFYSDFITPHPDPLKNPNPNQFLKVGPGVCFEFRFKLQDDKKLDCTAKLKEAIFRQILLTFGIGAKTNVGYGQFAPIPEAVKFEKDQQIKAKVVRLDNNWIYFRVEGNRELVRIQVAANKLKNYKEDSEYIIVVNAVNDDGSIRSIRLKN